MSNRYIEISRRYIHLTEVVYEDHLKAIDILSQEYGANIVIAWMSAAAKVTPRDYEDREERRNETNK